MPLKRRLLHTCRSHATVSRVIACTARQTAVSRGQPLKHSCGWHRKQAVQSAAVSDRSAQVLSRAHKQLMSCSMPALPYDVTSSA